VGLLGLSVTYSANGVAVAAPTRAGSYTVTAANPNLTVPAVTGTLVISQATPALTWASPADIVVGTALGAAQLDATAVFAGAPLVGTFSYTPAAGTVLPSGSGQTLKVTFTPADTIDFATVTSSVSINVASQSTSTPAPAPVTVQSVHWQTAKSKKATARVLIVSFSGALEPGPAQIPGNYELVALEKGKKPGALASKRVNLVSATYNPALGAVTLLPKGKVPNQTLQLTIVTAAIFDASGHTIAAGQGPGGNFVTTLPRA
jgi:hypothetical protein